MKCSSFHAVRWSLILFAMTAAASTVARAALPTLKVGSDAPPIAVAKWVKGTPVDTLEKGKVYVVEFWATWCGPCKMSIPHLTEMAHKYGDKVTFVGVSVFEQKNADYLAKIDSFVKDMGDKMDYHVAADDENKAVMAKTWMIAAAQNGIPTAFVVGPDGKIAWIGHPMNEMDKPIDGVLAGTWNMRAESERESKAAEQAEKQQAMFMPLSKAMQARDNKAIVVEADKLVAAHPEVEMRVASIKLSALLQTDEDAGLAYARKLFDGIGKNQYMILLQASQALQSRASQMKNPDYNLILQIAQRGDELAKHTHPTLLDTMAFAQSKLGQTDNAIDSEEKAIAAAQKMQGVPESYINVLKKHLEGYKTVKG